MNSLQLTHETFFDTLKFLKENRIFGKSSLIYFTLKYKLGKRYGDYIVADFTHGELLEYVNVTSQKIRDFFQESHENNIVGTYQLNAKKTIVIIPVGLKLFDKDKFESELPTSPISQLYCIEVVQISKFKRV